MLSLIRSGVKARLLPSSESAQVAQRFLSALASATALPAARPDTYNFQDDTVVSLRGRLERDATALDNTDPASSRCASLTRSGTASIATRLAKSVECHLEPGTPRYLSGATEVPTPQARVVVDARPPFRISWASAPWQALAGMELTAVEGRPALAVLLGVQSRQADVSSLEEAMVGRQRGCATIVCRSANRTGFPARVTVSPLMDSACDVTHMLCVVRPL